MVAGRVFAWGYNNHQAAFPRIAFGSLTVHKQLMVPKVRQKESRKEKKLSIWGPRERGKR